jgi:thiamine monophosphate kinase
MQIVVLPEVIEQKLKVEERKEVIAFINNLIADTSDGLKKDIIEILEERFEKKLSVELVNLKMELNERITSNSEKLRAELVEKIANSKVETIKWMFIFWIGNVITIIGGIIGILKIAKVF